MRILIVKTSSLGDVVHMLPALTDAQRRLPALRADWVVEESFAAIPGWHPAVDRVLPVAIRRWRKQPLNRAVWREVGAFKAALTAQRYDAVVDTQGLLKSAWIARLARGPRWGYDRASAREPLASPFYTHRLAVARAQHAIERNRQLLAGALAYALEGLALDYGLSRPPSATADLPPVPPRHVLALHGTSRVDKEWPRAQWIELAHRLAERGSGLVLPWGNARERERAEAIAAASPASIVLPRLGLDALASLIAQAPAVVGMDTGLMHLAAAYGRPGVALYPATAPTLTGVRSAPGAPAIVNLDGRTEVLSATRVLGLLQPWLRRTDAT
ncbi:MAG: lipopolysaccharide heptosyltransferase I [Tibeticola sp.]